MSGREVAAQPAQRSAAMEARREFLRKVGGAAGVLVLGWPALASAEEKTPKAEEKKAPEPKLAEVCKTCPKSDTDECPGPENCPRVKHAEPAGNVVLCPKCGEQKGGAKCCKPEGRQKCAKCGCFAGSPGCQKACCTK